MHKMQNMWGSTYFAKRVEPFRRVHVYESDNTVILHSKITKITPERPQIIPDHTRSSKNHELGTDIFSYWASQKQFFFWSLLSVSKVRRKKNISGHN